MEMVPPWIEILSAAGAISGGLILAPVSFASIPGLFLGGFFLGFSFF